MNPEYKQKTQYHQQLVPLDDPLAPLPLKTHTVMIRVPEDQIQSMKPVNTYQEIQNLETLENQRQNECTIYYEESEIGPEQQANCKMEPMDNEIAENYDNIPLTQLKKTYIETNGVKKERKRSLKPNPQQWACNVRKLKHQKGEAYINRRGKYVPERKIKTLKDCLTSCKYKCSENISQEDREQIFKAFYSLNANEKRHYLLNTTERQYTKQFIREPDTCLGRKYAFKYFFTVRNEKLLVCKHFYLGTLSISQKPVYNVHENKSDLNTPKPDGRGLSETSKHGISDAVKDKVRLHILSFKTVNSKTIQKHSKKKQYLEKSLSIKKMYKSYVKECGKSDMEPVKESMYRKIFLNDFNLHFANNSEQLCGRCNCLIEKK